MTPHRRPRFLVVTAPLLAAFALVVVASASCGGCSGDEPNRCASDDQCDVSEQCADGFCTKRCDPACGDSEVCGDDGACYPRNCPGTNELCPDNAYCDAGRCIFHGCKAVTCKAGEVCITGGQCVEKDCAGAVCGKDEVCAAKGSKQCTDAACYGTVCPEGQSCFSGRCRDHTCNGRSCGDSFCYDGYYCKDCPDKKCEGDTVCIDGECQGRGCAAKDPINCPCPADSPVPNAPGCGAAAVCVQNECIQKDCPTKRCPEGEVCAGTACTPLTCVRGNVTCGTGQECAADGKCYADTCGTTECPSGFVCGASGKCVARSCIGVSCDAGSECFGGGCYSKTCNGNPCPTGQLCISGECRPTYQDEPDPPPPPPGCDTTKVCPVGDACFAGGCFPTSCGVDEDGDELHCPTGQVCIEGSCGDRFPPPPTDPTAGCNEGTMCGTGEVCISGGCFPTKCGGTPCPTGQACIAGSCSATLPPPPPPPGPVVCSGIPCPDGYTCDKDNQCATPECIGGACGVKCGNNYCGKDSACWKGQCLSPCQGCAVGFGCLPGLLPPCYPMDCANVTCPTGQHCIHGTNGSAPFCERNECSSTKGEDVCGPSERCINGSCVPQACVGLTCGSNERCINGACIQRCCPGENCSPLGVCVGGVQLEQNCAGFACPTGYACAGNSCVPVTVVLNPTAPPPTRPPTTAQPSAEGVMCNGRDDNLNGLVDDIHAYPGFYRNGPYAKYIDKNSDVAKGKACTWCNATTGADQSDPANWQCLSTATDGGRSIYLGLKRDANWFPEKKDPNLWAVSSCVETILPARVRAKSISLRYAGASLMPCNRGDDCSGNCPGALVVLFTKKSATSAWVEQCDFATILDVYRTKRCELDWDAPYQDIERILVCRDTSYANGDPANNQNIAVDGISVEGCGCAPIGSKCP